MSIVEQLLQELDRISKQLREIPALDDGVYETVKERCSRLSTQLAVQHRLQKTISSIIHSELAVSLPNAHSRICKFLDSLYRNGETSNSASKLRWQTLRGLDFRTFLLIAISYTPLEIQKMHRTEFEYLIQNAAEYSSPPMDISQGCAIGPSPEIGPFKYQTF
jgi:hypothetical protein